MPLRDTQQFPAVACPWQVYSPNWSPAGDSNTVHPAYKAGHHQQCLLGNLVGPVGFEPTMGLSPSGLKVRHLRPLGYDPGTTGARPWNRTTRIRLTRSAFRQSELDGQLEPNLRVALSISSLPRTCPAVWA